MYRLRKLAYVALATAIVVPLALRASAKTPEEKCRDAVYKTAGKVGDQEGKGNGKSCTKGLSGDQTTCIQGDQPKSSDAGGKLEALFAAGGKCETVPTGVRTSSGGKDITDAMQAAADNIAYAAFGKPYNGLDASKCQDKIMARAGKKLGAILKAFRKCAAGADNSTCVTTALGDAKAASTQTKLDADVAALCDTPPAGAEDGRCLGASDAAGYSSCIGEVVNYEACTAINKMAGYSVACPGPSGGHKCTFDETTDNSEFDLRVQGNASLAGIVGPIAGAVDISCLGAPGTDGKRTCRCDLQAWTPVAITGIGVVCINASQCPVGEQDCDGGNELGIDASDNSGIGLCTGHADCSTQCDNHCLGLSKVQWRSTCDLFCLGGARDGLPCICDQVGSSGCVGGVAGTDDCPGGSCGGKNNEATSDCQCQCIDYSAGGASTAGDVQCNMGTEIIVVASPPCGSPPLLQLPPVCAPVTSEQTTGFTANANESGVGTIGPNTTVGLPETCANVDTSVTTGFTVATDIGFPDSTIGDIRAILTLDCQ